MRRNLTVMLMKHMSAKARHVWQEREGERERKLCPVLLHEGQSLPGVSASCTGYAAALVLRFLLQPASVALAGWDTEQTVAAVQSCLEYVKHKLTLDFSSSWASCAASARTLLVLFFRLAASCSA